MQKICEICGAVISGLDVQCEFNVQEDIAPWLDDYKAMHLGLMSHAEHQAVVARWSLHQPQGKSDKVMGKFAEIARSYWGMPLKLAADLLGLAD